MATACDIELDTMLLHLIESTKETHYICQISYISIGRMVSKVEGRGSTDTSPPPPPPPPYAFA